MQQPGGVSSSLYCPLSTPRWPPVRQPNSRCWTPEDALQANLIPNMFPSLFSFSVFEVVFLCLYFKAIHFHIRTLPKYLQSHSPPPQKSALLTFRLACRQLLAACALFAADAHHGEQREAEERFLRFLLSCRHGDREQKVLWINCCCEGDIFILTFDLRSRNLIYTPW